MTDTPNVQMPGKSRPAPAPETREDRLKAALKANMARRKAQARARSAGRDAAATVDGGDGETGADSAAEEQ